MSPGELFLILTGALAVTAFARWRNWSAPLLVTAVFLAVSYVPFVPQFDINGELVLAVVLPPLLYSAALNASYMSFRAALPQIRSLGVGLVLVTALTVGLVAFAIMPSLTLPGALLLGAIVAPPDAVSATAIGRRLGLPRRVMTVISGESLINDATSLTLFRVFVSIVAGVTVTWVGGIWQFAVAVIVGVGLGLIVGTLVNLYRMRWKDPVILGILGLLTPFAVYAIAEHIGGSGVLAVVATGLSVGHHAPRTNYVTRLQERPLWLSVDVALEGFVFALIGLQLHGAVVGVAESPLGLGHSLTLAAATLAVVIAVRPTWVFGSHYLWRWIGKRRIRHWRATRRSNAEGGRADARFRRHHSRPPRVQPRYSAVELTVISWAGMRGVVTLATATAIPSITDGGLATPERHTIFLVAFVVTVGTLLLQGLSLPWLIRLLQVGSDRDRSQEHAEISAARERSVRAGTAYLAHVRSQWAAQYGQSAIDPVFRLVTAEFASLTRTTDVLAGDGETDEAPSPQQLMELRRGWLHAKRQALIEERDSGRLDEETVRTLTFGLDAEELALDTSAPFREDPTDT